jgi:hypothetical protein
VSKRGGGWGRKALVAILNNEANISTWKVDTIHSSSEKVKWVMSKSNKAKTEMASPMVVASNEIAEL